VSGFFTLAGGRTTDCGTAQKIMHGNQRLAVIGMISANEQARVLRNGLTSRGMMDA
jgi:hypothetical protein